MTSNPPTPGTRFRLRRDVDRFPDFVARKGMTGTVNLVQADGLIVATMDQHIDGAEQWHNEIWWTGGPQEFCDDVAPLPSAR